MSTPDSFHIIGSRQFGGADQFYVRLVQELNDNGHHALGITRPGSPIAHALSELQLPQRHLPLASKWDFVSPAQLRCWVRADRPRIVQTYMSRATRLTRLAKFEDTAHIARLGGYYKIRGYYEHADAWVGNTKGLCDYMIKHGLPAERVFWIGNFVDDAEKVSQTELDTLREQLKLPDDALVLMTLGRFIDIKGFDDLLEAFARLPEQARGRPLHLIIVGDGPLKKNLHTLCESLDLTGRVHWPGWQNRPAPYFSLADAMICPSRKEALGNVILEAWSYQLPVVSTRTPGGLELIEDGINGLLCPLQDPPALAMAIKQLLDLPDDDWRTLAIQGHRTLARNHRRDSVLKAYQDLYTELGAEHSRAGA